MNIELTKKEAKTLSFYLQKALIDAEGMAAIGVGSNDTVKNVRSILAKVNGMSDCLEKKKFWIITKTVSNFDSATTSAYRFFGSKADLKKHLLKEIEEERNTLCDPLRGTFKAKDLKADGGGFLAFIDDVVFDVQYKAIPENSARIAV